MLEGLVRGIPQEISKHHLAEHLEKRAHGAGLTIAEKDLNRPWGGFLRFDDQNGPAFIDAYFRDVHLPEQPEGAPVSPKFLFVDPNKNLSWQVHERRGEAWRVLQGPVAVWRNDTDELPEEPIVLLEGDHIVLDAGTRHRLSGLNNTGIVAEVWVHKYPDNLSDEADNRRILDDFKRPSS